MGCNEQRSYGNKFNPPPPPPPPSPPPPPPPPSYRNSTKIGVFGLVGSHSMPLGAAAAQRLDVGGLGHSWIDDYSHANPARLRLLRREKPLMIEMPQIGYVNRCVRWRFRNCKAIRQATRHNVRDPPGGKAIVRTCPEKQNFELSQSIRGGHARLSHHTIDRSRISSTNDRRFAGIGEGIRRAAKA